MKNENVLLREYLKQHGVTAGYEARQSRQHVIGLGGGDGFTTQQEGVGRGGEALNISSSLEFVASCKHRLPVASAEGSTMRKNNFE